MSHTLSGVALVTGGGRGIGASIARELADGGMRVAVTGRTQAQVEAVAGEIGGLALVGDVSRRDNVEAWVRRVEEDLGPVDLLVDNAGIESAAGPLWEQDPDAWWHVFEVNVLGAMLCCRAVLPGMIERRSGRIVNIGSGGLSRSCSPTLSAICAVNVTRRPQSDRFPTLSALPGGVNVGTPANSGYRS